jgi:RNA polymerase sigma factor (sigma-70 family)
MRVMAEREGFSETLELLQRAAGGDSHALGEVFDRYQQPLLERIRLMMGEPARRAAESGDFLQGTFLEVVRGFDRFEVRDERAFLRWMTTIARNKIRAATRGHRAEALSVLSTTLTSMHAEPAGSASNAFGPEPELRLVEALEALPPDLRGVLELHDLEGRSFEDVGRSLGSHEHAVRRLHAKALIELANQFLRTEP